MKTSQLLNAAAAKISRFRLAGLSLITVLAAILFASPAAFADSFTITNPLGYSQGDGTSVLIQISFELNGNTPATVTMDAIPAWSVVSSLPDGDYASGPAAPVWTTTLTHSGDTATYSYLITNTGFSDGDGDSWSFMVPNAFNYTITAATGGGSATWAPMITLTDTEVPEPNSLYLLGTGLLALAGVVRRKLSRG